MDNNKEFQIFKNSEFGEIRLLEVDGVPWFVGREVAIALGYENAHDAMSKHVSKEDRQVFLKSSYATLDIPNRGLTMINESGLYSLVLSSSIPAAKRFKRWVTSEVLPAIRKHGLYAVEEVLANPDMLISALEALKVERAKNKALESTVTAQHKQLTEQKPKVDYYNLVLNDQSLVPISVIAKDYGWSAIKMNEYLHSKGVQYKQGRTWLLYQAYSDKGYAHTKTMVQQSNGRFIPLDQMDINRGYKTISVHTQWTQAGRLFIYELLKADGILPVIERESGVA